MADKPTDYPDWATTQETDPVSGQSNRVEPPNEKRESGFDRRSIPPRQWVNWLFWNVSEWVRWFDDRLNRPQAYAVADLPSAADNQYLFVIVTDEASGTVPAYSDGADWRRFSDNAIVSV